MKKKEEKHFLVDNLIKIMNYSKLNKVQFAEKIGFPEAKWNKIANGKQDIKISEISKIAETLRMREIDIYTYPDVYEKEDKTKKTTKILVELEVSDDEFHELGLRNKIKKILEKE